MTIVMSRSEIRRALDQQDAPVAVIPTIGSGAYQLAEEYGGRVTLLEAEELPVWRGPVLLMGMAYLPDALVAWLQSALPGFDPNALLTLEVHTGLLLTP